MRDEDKTKEQLLAELVELRQRLASASHRTAELEAVEAEQARAEEKLRRAQREWEEIFQAIGHPTLILDSQHNVIAANRAAMEATGKRGENLLGQKCYEVFHRSDRPPESCPLGKMLLSGRLESVEMEVEALGGIFLVSCTPVFDDQGNLEKVIHIATDITERVRSEEKRARAEEEAQQRWRELAALLDVSQALAATRDMGAVLQLITESATRLRGLESGAIYLLDGEELLLGATTPPLPPDLPQEFRRASLADHPHIQKALSSGLPVVLPDTMTADLTPAERGVSVSRGLRSVLYIPLLAGKQAVGTLILATVGQPQTFPKDEVDLYLSLAGQAALTIENVRLYKSIRRQAEELEQRVAERTAELRKMVNLMAGREVRMAELKEVIRQLRAQLEEAGLTPVADDPLLGENL